MPMSFADIREPEKAGPVAPAVTEVCPQTFCSCLTSAKAAFSNMQMHLLQQPQQLNVAGMGANM